MFDRESSFCGHAILNTRKLLNIPDTLNDWRFAGNPCTKGPLNIRFYAGSPIRINEPPQGEENPIEFAAGVVCLLDTKPKVLTDNEILQLEYLAEVVKDILDKNLQQIRLSEHEVMSSTLVRFTNYIPNDDTDLLLLAERYLKEAMNLENVLIKKWTPSGDTITLDDTIEIPIGNIGGIWESPDNAVASAIVHTITLSEEDQYIIAVYTNDTDSPRIFDIYDSNFVLHFATALTSALQVALVHKANRAKTMFIESVSHELRTPLHGILTSVDLMQEDSGITATQTGLINIIQASGKNLLNVINSLLDFNKWEKDEVLVIHEMFNVFDLQQDVVDALMINVNPDCEVLLEYDSRIDFRYPYVSSDPSILKQILANLLGNAIKFTNSGQIILRISLTDNTVIFEVQDTGIGMDRDFVENNLFVPFQKSDPFSQGIGLGLTIAKRLAKAIDATLVVKETAVGQGTTMQLTVNAPVDKNRRIETPLFDDWEYKVLGAETSCTQNITRLLDIMCSKVNPPVGKINIIDYDAASDEIIEIRIKSSQSDIFVLLCRPDAVALMSDSILGSKNVMTCTKPVGITKLINLFTTMKEKVVKKPSTPIESLRVLIVDDSLVNRNILAMYCKKRKIGYQTAVDGLDAFEKFKNNSFDVIFMDIQMPNCDGLTAVKMIRDYEKQTIQNNRNNSSVIIMLTGLSTDENKERSYSLGCDGYFVKPISLRIIDKLLENL